MTRDFVESTTSRFILLRIITYVGLALYTVCTKMAGLSNDNKVAVYFGAVYIVCLLGDLYCKFKDCLFRSKFQTIKCIVQLGLLTAGCFITKINAVEFIGVVVAYFCIYLEFILFDLSFDSMILLYKKILGGVLIALGCFRSIGGSMDTYMLIISGLCTTGIICITFAVSDYYNGTVAHYDKTIGSLNSNNESLVKENASLRTYQDKLNQVNNLINYQKIDLAKANNDLKALNADIRTLVEIMKNVSMTNDVPKGMNILLDNIMRDRKPDICGFYIRENVFIDNEPYMAIRTAREGSNDAPASNKAAEKLLGLNFREIFNTVASRKNNDIYEMRIDGTVHNSSEDFGLSMANLVIFPAILDNELYGILLVGDRSSGFFEGGYSFFESAVVNLSVSLKNTLLYLQMQDMARRDGLTGIYNRAYFNEIFYNISMKAADENGYLSVAMLDIDKFKNVNDTYGHLAGDAVIKMVANVVNSFAKQHKGVACRYGGEEFLLILPGKNVEDAYNTVTEMHDAIKASEVEFEQYKIHVNSSIGIASFPETTKTVHELLSRSDEAMYYGKEHGRGVVIIDGREEETLEKRK